MPLPDPWSPLRSLTPARIALGRAGGSLPTAALLDFQLAHARARDAVKHAADFGPVRRALEAAGLEAVPIESAATDHTTYLRRPDLGRRLGAASRADLASRTPSEPRDLALVIADGLSGLAVERHAASLAILVAEALRGRGWRLAPVTLVTRGRVAIGDEIGALLGARLAAVLIGERPGLSAPDSLGVYLTWDPRMGRTDAERNCLSNIRPEGLPVPLAADRLVRLLAQARSRGLTGIGLTEETAPRLGEPGSGS